MRLKSGVLHNLVVARPKGWGNYAAKIGVLHNLVVALPKGWGNDAAKIGGATLSCSCTA